MRTPEKENNSDFWIQLISYMVIMVVVYVVIAFVFWLVIYCIDNYNNALNSCMDKGYSKEYCEYMLN